MRKTISITNKKVEEILGNSLNASELIEVAILYYQGDLSKEYVDNYKQIQELTKKLDNARIK